MTTSTIRVAAKGRGRSKLEEARAQMYHDLVFECAERLFAAKGFEGTTMRDLAAEAGISPKTLYATFSSKEKLYREINATRGRALLACTASATKPPGSALERLARGIRAQVEFFLEHPSFFQIQVRAARSWGLTPPTGESLTEWRAGLKQEADLIRDGIAEGVFYDGDPELMATVAVAIVQVQLAGLLERRRKPDAEEISRELLVQLQRSFCKQPPIDGPQLAAAAS